RCAFGTLRDELIRDRIVVGLKDIKLSERLQLHANLTLENAMTMARQSETLTSNSNTGLKKTRKTLMGPGKHVLDVRGVFSTSISRNDKKIEEDIKNLFTPLLGRHAIEKLSLIARLDNITECQWLEKFPELFTGLGELKEEYCIKLQPNATPYSVNVARRIPVPLMEKVKEELSRMEKLDIIKKVVGPSDWCSGMVPVLKPDNTVRICVDLTKLNSAVRREKFILPSVDHTLGQLGRAKIFTKIDANSGFWQIRLAEESQPLTTFITPFGRYSFKRLPFGISSAPELFQMRMCQILEGLDGVTCHMDDILIYGSSSEEHDIRLDAALKKLQSAGLTLNRKKCEFAKTEVKFLGHKLSSGGLQPDPDKLAAVQNMREPTNVSE
ncbi:hypothetical protein QTP70_032192, partial [Hemibagrus guttatus]